MVNSVGVGMKEREEGGGKEKRDMFVSFLISTNLPPRPWYDM